MKIYLWLILLTFSFAEDNQSKQKIVVNESTFKNPKLYCTQCNLSMRETISRYVCWDNHMSVKKSDVDIDKDGKLFIVQNKEAVRYDGRSKIGAILIGASGALGLYMTNMEFEDINEWYDFWKNDAKMLNNVRFGLLLAGGLLLLID